MNYYEPIIDTDLRNVDQWHSIIVIHIKNIFIFEFFENPK